MKDIVDLLARFLIVTIFFYEAFDTIFFYERAKMEMITHGLTWNPDLLLKGKIVLSILGGLLLLIGYRVGFGVTLLMMYLIPATFMLYSFWNDPHDCYIKTNCLEGEDLYRREQGILFMKNLAIIGGLMMVWVNGSGRWSVKRLFATTKVRI